MQREGWGRAADCAFSDRGDGQDTDEAEPLTWPSSLLDKSQLLNPTGQTEKPET